jgi:ABC-2 type transport system ATP-binding protein
MEKVIETKNLKKKFGKILAVDNVSLEIEKGKIFGLIGPNGGGKTTLIRMILGILKPTEGEVFIFRKRMPDRKVLKKVGYMPQESALYENLTLKENLLTFGEIFGVKNLKERMKEVLKFVGLEGWENEMIENFSQGMKKRASFSVSLLPDPEILILDEPTVGIDPPLMVSFWEYFKELSKIGKTILITTHNLQEAMNCQEIGLMSKGKIILKGNPLELLKEHKVNSLLDLFLKFR